MSQAEQGTSGGILENVMAEAGNEYPDEPNTDTIDDQYMLGADLLVAPVMIEGARSRPVYFPAGMWHAFEDPSVTYEGPRFHEVDAPPDRIPVFVRQGAAIPMYAEPPQHLKGDLPETTIFSP